MKINKKILFIVTSLNEGGAGKMVHHVAGVVAKDFSDVYALAINNEELIPKDNGVHYLVSIREHKGGIIGFAKTINSIRNLIKKIKPDIVVSFVSDVAFCTRVATYGMKKLIVVSAERGDPFTLNKMWKILIRWTYKKSDYCFFQLPDARDFFGSIVAKKSFVIPNAAFFNGTRGSHHSLNKTIVSAGRFVWEKGYECLIEAFKMVHDKYPDYKLVLYGEGPFKGQYITQIKSLELEQYVSFPGYTNDVAGAFQNEGIFVLSSRYEGIPNVLIEALLVGIPTVSCDCTPGGPRFLTNNGERGSIVKVDDVNGIYKAIIQLIEDKTLYKKYETLGPNIIKELEPELVEKQWREAFINICLK